MMAGRTLAEIVSEHAEALLGRVVGGDERPEFPLLIKLLFPEEKLSVQVHPNDAHAQSMGQRRGKTECWYVLEARPGAAVALGLKDGTTAEQVRAAVSDASLEERLQWLPVAVGDMIFVDAGTVHAIGPGMVLLETQQTSDITFRLYDYGRPRELHLEQGISVMRMQTAAGRVAPQPREGFTRLIEQRYFIVDRYKLNAGAEVALEAAGAGCIVAIDGVVWMEGEGAERLELLRGRAVMVPAGSAVKVLADAEATFVRCTAPIQGEAREGAGK